MRVVSEKMNFLSTKKNSRRNFLFVALSAALFLVVFFLSKDFSLAQETGRRIAVTPLTFELRAERGETAGDYIRVLNPSYEDDISVRMESEDMFPEGEEGRVILQGMEEDEDVLSMSRWIVFEPENFVLEPREEKNVRFTINVPTNANPGGYYAGMIAGTQPTDSGRPGVGIIQRIASLVLLTVPGEMREELSVFDFDVSRKYYEHGPITFETRFENTGTIHLVPDAHIVIKDILGREIASTSIEKRNVLPGAVRKIETEWNVGWLWGGFYTATVKGTYGEFSEKDITSASASFFAFPWKAGVVIVLVLLFFVLTRKRWATVVRILVKGEAALAEKKE